jgi:hypothetical protein
LIFSHITKILCVLTLQAGEIKSSKLSLDLVCIFHKLGPEQQQLALDKLKELQVQDTEHAAAVPVASVPMEHEAEQQAMATAVA